MPPVPLPRTVANRPLAAIKALHTAAWLFFVGCIAGIPIATVLRRIFVAELLTAFVLVECLILVINRGRCPLTDLASRYTSNRQANFDIYLPEWLARHNKHVFGTIFAADLLFLTWQVGR